MVQLPGVAQIGHEQHRRMSKEASLDVHEVPSAGVQDGPWPTTRPFGAAKGRTQRMTKKNRSTKRTRTTRTRKQAPRRPAHRRALAASLPSVSNPKLTDAADAFR